MHQYTHLIVPPALQEGDKVAIVSPASRIDKALIKGLSNRLKSWGLVPQVAKHAASEYGRYAGKTSHRVADLQQALDDPEIKAIYCSRGGYGVMHLIDSLDFTAFRKSPKWVVGYSDITALHNLIQCNGIASLHAPMASHLTEEPADDPCTLFVKDILFGKLPHYSFQANRLQKAGTAKGILRGGNLSVLYGMRGTPYDIPAENTILFVEDVNERPHVVERMFYNLKLGGVLDKLSGLIIGQFTDYTEDCSLGRPLMESLADLLKPYNIPICFGFPVGHTAHNLPLISGSEVELTVNKKGVKLGFTRSSAYLCPDKD